jgi:hypothetical protein
MTNQPRIVNGDREVTITQGEIVIVVSAPVALGYDEVWEFGADAVTANRILRDSDGEVEAIEHLTDTAAIELLGCQPIIVAHAKARVRREIDARGLVVA